MANLFSEKPIVKVVMLKGQDGEEKLINQADGSGLSFWIGTQAEYDAIPEAELITDCVYYIIDDTRDDFNTRLNELDVKVDNNTVNIEKVINKMVVAYSKDTLPTGVMNEAILSKLSWVTIRAAKIGNTVQVFFSCQAGTETVAPGIADIAKLFYSGTPTTEQRKSVMPITPVFTPVYKRLPIDLPTYETDGVIGTAYINDFATAIDLNNLGIRPDFVLLTGNQALYSMVYQTEF